MEYSKQEQEAIVSVLYNLAHADYRRHDSENEVYFECLRELGFSDPDFKPYAKDALQSLAYETLKCMSKEKKHDFSLMMTRLSRSDGDFGVLERAMVIEILDMCDIPFVHK